jgi:hypothetical protein
MTGKKPCQRCKKIRLLLSLVIVATLYTVLMLNQGHVI